MRIFADKLADNLHKRLLNCYLVFGNEPLLLQESRDHIYQTAKQVGFEEKHRYQIDNRLDWSQVFDSCQSLSLFSSRQVIELEVPETGINATIAKELLQLASLIHSDLIIVLIGTKLTKAQESAKWFKALQAHGTLVSCNSPDLRQLPQFVAQRCRKLNLTPDAEAIQMLAQWHEGNLLALVQSLQKLALLYPDGELNLLRVQTALSRHNHFTPFQWSDALLEGKANRAQRILRQLEAEGQESVILLRTIQKELQLLYTFKLAQHQQQSLADIFNQYRVWQNKRPLYSQALQRLDITAIYALFDLLNQLELSIKTTFEQNEWRLLQQLSLQFCLPQAANAIRNS